MSEIFWLIAAFLACITGMGWLALSLESHWRQVFAPAPLAVTTCRRLRLSGAAALVAALIASFAANHPSMAPLVWFMEIAVAAFVIAMALASRPHVLTLITPRPLRG